VLLGNTDFDSDFVASPGTVDLLGGASQAYNPLDYTHILNALLGSQLLDLAAQP
jgi:hypothetical protein